VPDVLAGACAACRCEAPEILRVISVAAAALGFTVPGVSRNFKVRMEGHSRRGPLVALAQVFEMCPGLYMVEVRKVRGDTIEFNDFYRRFEERCGPVVLAPGGGAPGSDAVASGASAAPLLAAGDRQPLLSSSI
jgi:hypothetical protein